MYPTYHFFTYDVVVLSNLNVMYVHPSYLVRNKLIHKQFKAKNLSLNTAQNEQNLTYGSLTLADCQYTVKPALKC